MDEAKALQYIRPRKRMDRSGTHNHSYAPCEGDTGKEISRAQLAYENSGRGLEDNVGHEEYQDNNRLAER